MKVLLEMERNPRKKRMEVILMRHEPFSAQREHETIACFYVDDGSIHEAAMKVLFKTYLDLLNFKGDDE